MLIQEKLGQLHAFDIGNRRIDLLPLEWHEANKHILHRQTKGGTEVVLKFLKESPCLAQDDVLYADESCLIVVDILPCPAIVVRPTTMYGMASLCYEIGNKHLPLFYEQNEVLTPYEAPLFRLLAAAGFEPEQEERKLLHPLRTSVSPHPHSGGGSLFSRILQLTTPSANA